MNPIYWLALFVVLLIIEIATMGLTTIWFAGGALAAFLVSILGIGFAGQVILFLVVSILLLVLTRPIAMKHFNGDRAKTNVDSVIGKEALVTEEINPHNAAGRVELNGMEWSAKAAEGSGVVSKGTLVEVLKVEGVKLIVRMKEA